MTTLKRFENIYSDWCDSHDRRVEIVEESLDDLKKFGISLLSKLEQSITHIRWTTKGERRKHNLERRNRGDLSPRNRFIELYKVKADVFWKAADEEEKQMKEEEARYNASSGESNSTDKEEAARAYRKLKHKRKYQIDLLRFKAVEVAYTYFLHEEKMVVITEDENDSITYDDIVQQMSSFFSEWYFAIKFDQKNRDEMRNSLTVANYV